MKTRFLAFITFWIAIKAVLLNFMCFRTITNLSGTMLLSVNPCRGDPHSIIILKANLLKLIRCIQYFRQKHDQLKINE